MSGGNNKPVSYPKNHNLLDTDGYKEIRVFVQVNHPKQTPASKILRERFGIPLGNEKARRSK